MRTAHTPPHTITSACSTGLSHRAHTTQCTTHTPHALLALTAATRRSHATPPPPEPRAAAWMLRTSHLARTTPSTHTNHASNNHRATHDLRALHKKRNPSSEQLVRDLATSTQATASTSTQRQTRTRTPPPTTQDRRHRSPDAKPRITMGQVSQDIQQEWELCRTQSSSHLSASTSTPVSKIVYVLL